MVFMAYIMVCFNGDVVVIFEDWICKMMFDWVDWVFNCICDVYGGELNDSCFGICMRGEG